MQNKVGSRKTPPSDISKRIQYSTVLSAIQAKSERILQSISSKRGV